MAAALLLQVTMLTKDLSLTKRPRLKHLFLMPACQPLYRSEQSTPLKFWFGKKEFPEL